MRGREGEREGWGRKREGGNKGRGRVGNCTVAGTYTSVDTIHPSLVPRLSLLRASNSRL